VVKIDLSRTTNRSFWLNLADQPKGHKEKQYFHLKGIHVFHLHSMHHLCGSKKVSTSTNLQSIYIGVAFDLLLLYDFFLDLNIVGP
jgi:hypothetical protein